MSSSSPQSGRALPTAHHARVEPPAGALAQRRKESFFALLLFLTWLSLSVAAFGIYISLLFEHGLADLWKVFVFLHPSVFNTVILSLLGIGLAAYVVSSVHQHTHLFFSIKAFQKLYRACYYIDPVEMIQYRIPYVILSRPSRFQYAFSGTKLVILIRRTSDRLPQQSDETIVRGEARLLQNGLQERTDILSLPPLMTNTTVVESTASPPAYVESEPEHEEMVGQISLEQDMSEHEKAEEETPASAEGSIRERMRLLVIVHQGISLELMAEEEVPSASKTRKVRAEVPLLGNVFYEAIMARLAVQEGGWVKRDVMLENLYGKGKEDPEKLQQAFTNNTRRIRERVTRCLTEHFPQWAAQADEFKPFEWRGKKESKWRLSEVCRVQGLGPLNQWYRKVSGKKTEKETWFLTESELFRVASQLIGLYSQHYLENHADETGYSGGYLVWVMHQEPFEVWAPSFFKECRSKYIALLTYFAKCAYRLWLNKREDRYIEKAAMWYKECAYAATCEPLDHVQGEATLCSCIEMYLLKSDKQAAQSVLSVYIRRVERVVSEWEPQAATMAAIKRAGLVVE